MRVATLVTHDVWHMNRSRFLNISLHAKSTSPFFVPFKNGFHAVLWGWLHVMLKRSKLVILMVRVDELYSNKNWKPVIGNFAPYAAHLTRDFYRLQRSCEGYVFIPVCHSVQRGGVLPQCMLGYHPPGSRPPPKPPDQVLPGSRPPPPQTRQMVTVADGTHPTGMHSCLFLWINWLTANSVADQYCDPLGDYTVFGFNRLLNNSQTVPNDNVIVAGARVIEFSFFYCFEFQILILWWMTLTLLILVEITRYNFVGFLSGKQLTAIFLYSSSSWTRLACLTTYIRARIQPSLVS